MLQRIRNRKGFTLVELMIVVAIIGILAAIAIPNFLNFRLKAKTSEAKSNLGAIRSTEVAYFAENNLYVNNQVATPILNRAGDDQKQPWVGTTRFSILGFAPEGRVFFSYSLDAGAVVNPSDTVDFSGQGFLSHAIGDLDNDNQTSDFTVSNTTTEIIKGGAPF